MFEGSDIDGFGWGEDGGLTWPGKPEVGGGFLSGRNMSSGKLWAML